MLSKVIGGIDSKTNGCLGTGVLGLFIDGRQMCGMWRLIYIGRGRLSRFCVDLDP